MEPCSSINTPSPRCQRRACYPTWSAFLWHSRARTTFSRGTRDSTRFGFVSKFIQRVRAWLHVQRVKLVPQRLRSIAELGAVHLEFQTQRTRQTLLPLTRLRRFNHA